MYMHRPTDGHMDAQTDRLIPVYCTLTDLGQLNNFCSYIDITIIVGKYENYKKKIDI